MRSFVHQTILLTGLLTGVIVVLYAAFADHPYVLVGGAGVTLFSAVGLVRLGMLMMP